MKAFRGEPSIFISARPEERRAELEVTDLTLKFGGITALSKINLSVRNGELISIIGPNGAGKTSLLNCVTGYYKPQEGQIFFNGKDVTHLSTHHLTKIGIGRTYQNIELFPGMTVLSNMLLARHVHCEYGVGKASLFLKSVREEEVRHREILEELIDFLEMQSIRKQLVGSLPYGMRKRVELGRALALRPKLLVLDEPFAGMTLEEKEDMVRFLVELNEAWNQTMILVEHDMSIVMSISKRVAVFDFGVKIAEGSPDFVQDHPQVIKAYLGDTSKIE
jgi:branched-chain amino acid transport system ATP-binding protein